MLWPFTAFKFWDTHHFDRGERFWDTHHFDKILVRFWDTHLFDRGVVVCLA